VYPVFVSNEPELLRQIGFPTRLFHPSEYGVPTLGLTYIARRQTLEQEPELLARFLRATLHAVEFARSDADAAVDVVMRYAPQESRSHQAYMLRTELEMAAGPITQRHGPGWSTEDQWQALHDSLLKYGGLAAPTDVKLAFSDAVLQRVYRDGKLQWP
jgi:ABC-type nitrate/sulfonate/bicarbonate transport system substrate-binding protein